MADGPVTPAQIDCLRHLVETGQDLIHISGGRYTTRDCPCPRRGFPRWYTRTLTVRSMIRRGWLRKVDEAVKEEWRAEWTLGDLGREVLSRHGG
jgi:hypothetical protein